MWYIRNIASLREELMSFMKDLESQLDEAYSDTDPIAPLLLEGLGVYCTFSMLSVEARAVRWLHWCMGKSRTGYNVHTDYLRMMQTLLSRLVQESSGKVFLPLLDIVPFNHLNSIVDRGYKFTEVSKEDARRLVLAYIGMVCIEVIEEVKVSKGGNPLFTRIDTALWDYLLKDKIRGRFSTDNVEYLMKNCELSQKHRSLLSEESNKYSIKE